MFGDDEDHATFPQFIAFAELFTELIGFVSHSKCQSIATLLPVSGHDQGRGFKNSLRIEVVVCCQYSYSLRILINLPPLFKHSIHER